MLDRPTTEADELVGVSVYQGNGYHFLRMHLRTPQLKRLGNPAKLLIRGQPANGFKVIPDKDGLKPRKAGKGLLYLSTTVTNFELSRRERRAVYVRPTFEYGHMKVPALPKAWIDAEAEFAPSEAVLLPKNSRDDALPVRNGNGASPTTPLPKPQLPTYQVPKDADIAALQVLLGDKLDEARAIIRHIEARTGLRFVLDRNLRLVVALK